MRHRPELHPLDVAEMEHNRKALEQRAHDTQLHARDIALSAARWYYRDRNEDPTPEQTMSVAAKFESYLTAPAVVLDESLNTR